MTKLEQVKQLLTAEHIDVIIDWLDFVDEVLEKVSEQYPEVGKLWGVEGYKAAEENEIQRDLLKVKNVLWPVMQS